MRQTMTYAGALLFSAGLLVGCSDTDHPTHLDPSTDAGTGATGTGGASAGGANTGGVPSNTGGSTSGTGGTTGSSGSEVSFDGTHIRASIIARQVTPGDEQHVCVVVHLPNTDAVWIDQVHATLTGGSHHLIVDRQSVGTPEQRTPAPCAPTMASDTTRLIIAQQAETTLSLPAGTAFSMEPHQPLFLQLHYFNAGDEVRDIDGTVELTLATTGGAPPVEAKSLFTGSFAISLQPQSPGQSEAFFVPMPESAGTRHVFALTSHTHSLGVRATIERVGSETAPPSTPIHTSTNWDEPPLTTFTPPLDFQGTDGLRLICDYQNDTNRTVHFGTAFEDEMCFMWVYYYDQ